MKYRIDCTSETRKQNLRLQVSFAHKKINGQPLYNITTVKIFFCLVSKQHPAKPKSTNLRLLARVQHATMATERRTEEKHRI